MLGEASTHATNKTQNDVKDINESKQGARRKTRGRAKAMAGARDFNSSNTLGDQTNKQKSKNEPKDMKWMYNSSILRFIESSPEHLAMLEHELRNLATIDMKKSHILLKPIPSIQDFNNWKPQCKRLLISFLNEYCFKTTNIEYVDNTITSSSNCGIIFTSQGQGYSVTMVGLEKEVVKQKYLIEKYNMEVKRRRRDTKFVPIYPLHFCRIRNALKQEIKRLTGVDVQIENGRVTLCGDIDRITHARNILITDLQRNETKEIKVSNWMLGGLQFESAREQFPEVITNITESTITLSGHPYEVNIICSNLEKQIKNLNGPLAHETIKVDKKYHKFITGKNGSKINELCLKHQVEIKLPNQKSTFSGIVIEGAKEQVAAAVSELSTIVENAKINATTTSSINVSKWLLKHLKAVEEESKRQFPEVKIESREDKVIFTGHLTEIKFVQKKFEMEVAKIKDTNCSEEVMVKPEYRKFLIGKKGVKIKELRQRYKVEIEIPASNLNSSVVTIVGKREDVSDARSGILNLVKSHESNITKSLFVPDWLLKHIIGKDGSTLKELENKFPQLNLTTDTCRVWMKGQIEQVEESFKTLSEKLEDLKRTMCLASIPLNANLVRALVKSIKKIENMYNVSVRYTVVPPFIYIDGEKDAVDKAQVYVEQEKEILTNMKTLSLKIDPCYHGKLIGTGGANINRLRNEFPKVIDIQIPGKGSNNDIVTITGDKSAITLLKLHLEAKYCAVLVDEGKPNFYLRDRRRRSTHSNLVRRSHYNSNMSLPAMRSSSPTLSDSVSVADLFDSSDDPLFTGKNAMPKNAGVEKVAEKVPEVNPPRTTEQPKPTHNIPNSGDFDPVIASHYYIARSKQKYVLRLTSQLMEFSSVVIKSHPLTGLLITGKTSAINDARSFLDVLEIEEVLMRMFGVYQFLFENNSFVELIANKHHCSVCVEKVVDAKAALNFEHIGSEQNSIKTENEVQYDNITVIVEKGDITDDKADIIVNSTESSFSLSGPLSQAIIAKAGSAVQYWCAQETGSKIRMTDAGNLQCKKILHAVIPSTKSRMDDFIVDILQKAEDNIARSITLPAIGTGGGGWKAQDVAEGMRMGILRFVRKRTHKSLKKIKIMLLPAMRPADIQLFYLTLLQDITSDDLTEEVSLLSRIVGFFSRNNSRAATTTASAASNQIKVSSTDTNSDNLRNSNTTSGESAKVVLLSNDESNIKMVKKELQKFVDLHLKKFTIDNDVICNMKMKDVEKIKDVALQLKVRVLVNQTRNVHCIEVQGHIEKANTATEEIRRIVDDIASGLPSTWDPMGDQTMKRITLNPHSDEYSVVKTKFLKTLQKSCSICSIERIQNSSLYKQYTLKKEEIIKRINRTGETVVAVERTLFHGTVADSVISISTDGFNRSYAGKNATAYGKGVYFSSTSTYSDSYARCNSSGIQTMFLAEVLTGSYCAGSSYMVVPPINPATQENFDSVVDNMLNPAIFVVFKDASVYPNYLISYKT